MRIAEVALQPFSLPLRAALATARGPVAERSGVLVRLIAEDGAEGLGEATPHPHDGDAGLARLGHDLAHAAMELRGADLARADELIDVAGTLDRAAAMGLDMALHDLIARRRGIGVAELLGGACVPVTASALLDGDVVASAASAAAAGFRTVKLKAGPDVEATCALARDVARAAPALSLRIDANGAWDLERTQRALDRLDPARIAWLEQPVPADDRDGLAAACGHALARGHRIAADECVRGPEDVRALAARHGADVIVVKLVQVGGLRRAIATAVAARAAGLDVVVTTGLESSLGSAAALHLASALAARGEAALPAGIATTGLFAEDLVEVPVVAAPSMRPPAGPGLGITLAPRWRARGWPEQETSLGGVA